MSDIQELAKALNAFQAELVSVGKTADNPFFKSKYAELGAIMKEAQPVLTKHGLAVMQLPDNIDGKPALTTIVMHTSGQSQRATVPLILAKDDPQGLGSAITYERRYSYAAALQIVIDEDDDGNRASNHQRQARPAVGTAAPEYEDIPVVPDKPQARRRVSEPQVKLLLARSRDASGLSDRQDIFDWFLEKVGCMPNEVHMDEVDDVLKVIGGDA